MARFRCTSDTTFLGAQATPAPVSLKLTWHFTGKQIKANQSDHFRVLSMESIALLSVSRFSGTCVFPISLSLPTYHASGTCHILAMCSVMYLTYRRGLRDQKIVDDYYSMDFLSHHITQHDFCYLHICTPLSDPTWQSKGRFQMFSIYLVHDAALCWTWVIYQTLPTHGKV